MPLAINHITTISDTTEGFAVAILVLVAASAMCLVLAHVVDRGVDPVRDAISDFGARQHPWYYRLNVIWLGLAGLLTAVMLADAVFPKPTLTILALLVYAAARWAITIYPTDLPDAEETAVGRSHVVLAVAAFTAISLAALAFAFTVAADDPFWSDYGTLFTALAGLLVGFALATGIARLRMSPIFGLVERLLYLAIYAWQVAVALVVLLG